MPQNQTPQTANYRRTASLIPLAALSLGLSLGLSACKRVDSSAPPAETADAGNGNGNAANPPATANATSAAVRYSCANGWSVSAAYADWEDGEPGVQLTFQGKSYSLYGVPSGSGAKYATENGLNPDYLLVWWTKSTEATMIESPLDDSAGPDDERTVTTCTEAG